MLKAIEVKPLAGHKLWLRYKDGTEGEVNLSHLVGKGVFAEWNDPGAFEHVHIGPTGNIRWSDQIDLCPDALYLEITGKSPEEVFPGLSAVVDV